jgi:hypothetical protein
MPNTQRIIATAVPGALQHEPEAIAVSVILSPRLSGADVLGGYPDWVNWPQHCRDHGLKATFECNGAQLEVDLDLSALRPDLWERLFTAQTFVRSYEFDDYSRSFVASYDTRLAHGLIQSAYQRIGIDYAEIDTRIEADGRQGRRARFAGEMRGFSRDPAKTLAQLRDQLSKAHPEALASALGRSVPADAVRADGLLATGAIDPADAGLPEARLRLVQSWQVFHHIPQGAELDLDTEHVLDFHQALSALGPHRILQRYLGLAFDLTLPTEFVTGGEHAPGQLRIVGLNAGWSSDVTTAVPATSTAYLYFTEKNQRWFAVAPAVTLGSAAGPTQLGLLRLDPRWFGVAQLDVDGALHKTVQQADNAAGLPGEASAQHLDVFDPATTLSALRSGGLSLFATARALTMKSAFERASAHNTDLEAGAPQRQPFCAEDLTRGYRLDIWDSVTGAWHSVHRRNATLYIGPDRVEISVGDDEGFVQAAVTRAAPEANGTPADTDLHLHEALVRWSGWSLSASHTGQHLTRSGDPDKALQDPDNPDPENVAVTPFSITTTATVMPGTLPRLRYGVGYRLRLRAVDLAGNGLDLNDPALTLVSPLFSLPSGDAVTPYLRFEPVAPPVVVLRDETGLTGSGSSVDRLVIRTYNASPDNDGTAADLSGAERHIAPPQVHVEQAERHGMFDRSDGTLDPSPAMWQLIKNRDAGAFPLTPIGLGGSQQKIPVDGAAQAKLPYLPDPLARAAVFRDLPGSAGPSVGRVAPGSGSAGPVGYTVLTDPQARRGAATIVEFGGRDDWQHVRPFRLALADGDSPPQWDPAAGVLTVAVPKGTTAIVPLSSCCDAGDLANLGVWSWLREYIEYLTAQQPQSEEYVQPPLRDRVAHVLQLATEGGHGMLTPPRLLTLVHAVQQPMGRPAFSRLTAQLPAATIVTSLLTQPETYPTADTEMDVLTAWRTLGSTDTYLVGALQVHGASTAKLDLHATWTDPVDDLMADPTTQSFSAFVDEIGLPTLNAGPLLRVGENRCTGYYVPDHDLIVCAPNGTRLGNFASGVSLSVDAIPRHRIGDTRHHVVTYMAVATSRYQEYFPAESGGTALDFTRASDPIVVHVPASARPVAPAINYVVPTFGWERVETGNQLRSVRTGGGLRVYLDRPWYASGVGELLGVTLSPNNSAVERERWKGKITMWGEDPIWASPHSLASFPSISAFPDRVADESNLPLDGDFYVDVAGHEVRWDVDRKLYYCDLTVDTATTVYAPFVRLALTRYQPYALVSAKLSRVMLADIAQLTPERALTVTADPFVPGQLRLTVSGPAATGPVIASAGIAAARPSSITVTVQEKDPTLDSDLSWRTSPDFIVTALTAPADAPPPDYLLWSATVRYTGTASLQPGRYRLLIKEQERYPADTSRVLAATLPVMRLVYAETVPLDTTLLQGSPYPAATTKTG